MPQPTYGIVDYDSVFKVKGTKVQTKSLKGDELLGGNQTTTQLLAAIETSPALYSKEQEQPTVVQAYGTLAELFAASDYVVQGEITNFYNWHPYTDGLYVDIQIAHKGDKLSTDGVLGVPRNENLEIGKQCLLFLRVRKDGTSEPAARRGAVLTENDGQVWTDAMDFLSQQ